ncbi:hypothetical protein GCM10027579_12730 [Calidifontibacter terrae]
MNTLRRSLLWTGLLSGTAAAVAAETLPLTWEGVGAALSGQQFARHLLQGGLFGLLPRWVGLLLLAPVVAVALAWVAVATQTRWWWWVAVVLAVIGVVPVVLVGRIYPVGSGGRSAEALPMLLLVAMIAHRALSPTCGTSARHSGSPTVASPPAARRDEEGS